MPGLKRKAKDGDDAVHGFVLPSHRATAIRRVVPEARAGSMKAGTVLLHDGTRYDVLGDKERILETKLPANRKWR